MKKTIIYIFSILITNGFIANTFGQLTLDNTYTPQQLVQNVLLGSGANVSNIQYTGDVVQLGKFTNVNTDLPISYGVIMSSGDINVAQGPNNQSGATLGSFNGNGDPDLTTVANWTTYDACVLEFDFVPTGDTIRFNYSFASEEYLEWVNSQFNDVFGFFLSGPGINGPYSNNAVNIALLPDFITPVSINTVNSTSNWQYYHDNGDGFTPPYNTSNYYIQFDGRTVTLEASYPVMCDSTYHIKLAISDAGDHVLDSGVFLEGGSFGSNAIEVNITTATGDSTIIEGCSDATFSIIRTDTLDTMIVFVDLSGTATNDTDYTFINDSLEFLPGDDTMDIVIWGNPDTNEEGMESVIITVYTVTPCGDTIPHTATVWIVDTNYITVTAPDLSITCPQDSVMVFASAIGGLKPFHFSWSTGDQTDTIWVSGMVTDTFIVTVIDSCGMSPEIDTVIVNVNSQPLNLQLNDTSVLCANDSVNLWALVSGGTPQYYYTWNTGYTTSGIIVNPSSTTTYSVTVTDSCGVDTVFQQVTVTVPQYPQLTVSYPDQTLDCPGDTKWLTANVNGGVGYGYTYNWTWISGNSNDSTINSGQVFDTAYYVIEVTDPCNETASDTVWVFAPKYDSIMISTDDQLICPGNIIDLTSQITGGTGDYVYSWSGSGDIQNGNSNNATVIPSDAGTYTIEVEDNCGNKNTAEIQVKFDDCEITIPNVFTPNGDGMNEFFYIVNLDKHPNSKLVIFNRWGKKIYESSDYQNDWNGDKHTDGTYYWILYMQDGSSEHGYVTIIR